MLLRDFVDPQEVLNLCGLRVWNLNCTRAGTVLAVWAEFQDPAQPGHTGPYLCIQWDRDLHGNAGINGGVSYWWQRDLELQVVLH